MRLGRVSWWSIGVGLVLLVPFASTVRAAGRLAATRPLTVPGYAQHVGPIRPLAGGAPVQGTLVLAPGNAAGLQAAAVATVTRGRASYHHWWKPAAILKAFGPSASTLHSLLVTLRQQGFHASANGWVVNAYAPAAVWQRVLGMKLGTVVRQGHTYRVQASAGVEPPWMSSVVLGVDGLTTLPPPAAPVHPAMHRVATAKNPRILSTPVPESLAVTAQNGAFQVTATIPGGVGKATGQPVHVILTATMNGVPAPDAGLTANSLGGSTSTGQAVWSAYSYRYNGTIEFPLYADQPLSAGLNVTVYSAVESGQPAPGAVAATVTLPTLTWTGASTVQGLDAAQINSVYHASNLSATTPSSPAPTIGLYESEPPSSSMMAALSNFSTANGLVPPSVSTWNVNYGTPGPGSGGEENMDLQAVEATAPGSHLLVYSDPQNDMANTLNTVAQQDAVSVFSMSVATSGAASYLSPLTNTLATEGITVIASAGDWGTITGCGPNFNATPTMNPPGICEPADFETVTAVGGTDVSVNQSGQAYYTQAWGGVYLSSLPTVLEAYVLSQFAASGGGYSQTQPVPSWQQGFVPAAASGKGVPDVALLADPNVAGIEMYDRSGQAVIRGGTSLGAPLLAGWVGDVVAETNQNQGDIAPTFYALASADPGAFTQAARGDNGAYQITSQDNPPGTWNPVTGLGSPNIDLWASFVENGAQLAAPILKVPSTASYGSPVTVSASWAGTTGATFQYWWQDPRDGVWHNSGAYASGSYSFVPPVPGTFPVVAYAQAPGQSSTRTATATVTVSTTAPMVSSLMVNYLGSHVEPAGATVTFTASATDSGAKPVYQFWVHGPNNVWKIAQNYDPTNTFTLSNLAPGSYTIAAYALDQQQVTAGAWNQVYGYATVVNVDSRVSLTVPSTGTVDTAIPLTATATNITNPVFQVWIRSPSGSWSQSGAYSHSSTYTFTPTTSGIYTVVVYAKDPYAPNTAVYAVVAEQQLTVGP